MGKLQIAMRSMPKDFDHSEAIGIRLLQSVWKRGATAGLSTFVLSPRKQASCPCGDQAGPLIEDTIEYCQRRQVRPLELETDFDEQSMEYEAWIPTVMENALLNLVIIARDAMDGKGKLTITCVLMRPLAKHFVRTHPDVKAGQYH